MSEWIRVLAAFVFCFHTSIAESLVTQDPTSISTSPGKTVKMTCTLSGAQMRSYGTSWYWQKTGSAPVLVWYEGNRASGIPDRFTGTVDDPNNMMHLTITNLRSEDVADYYCFVSTIGFGKGTKLNLSSPQPPAVSVLGPSEEEIAGKGTATLVCLVNGFNPGVVDIEWTVDGSARSDGVDTGRAQQDQDNMFSTSSYLTLPAAYWNSHELYSCVVKHETQTNPLKTNIARSGCA
ncbi:immunoglobulin lambda-1 light chain-like [Amblyraja radiata]|uniref:immunoglobulin lambda-1 light chain-like n=1 Tax=Amblyraja radiata TaxID=386614 RepID=UPI001402A6CD|nr:immunoglobulin lambda-1 light chain-like [Amblyraja radiata]